MSLRCNRYSLKPLLNVFVFVFVLFYLLIQAHLRHNKLFSERLQNEAETMLFSDETPDLNCQTNVPAASQTLRKSKHSSFPSRTRENMRLITDLSARSVFRRGSSLLFIFSHPWKMGASVSLHPSFFFSFPACQNLELLV